MRNAKGVRVIRLTDRNVGILLALSGRRIDYTDQLLRGFVLRLNMGERGAVA